MKAQSALLGVLLLPLLLLACNGGAAPVPPRTQIPPSPTPLPTHQLPTPTPTVPIPTATGATQEQTYRVQPGDTLYAIARRFGTTADAIAARNGLADPNAIEPGMLLIIPAASVTPATPTTSLSPSRVVRHGDRHTPTVALTFDMGGRVDPAIDIMQWLIANRVPATIFVTGAIVDSQVTDAGRQVVHLVAAHPDLFELGNHSYSHPDFRQLDADIILDELARTEAAVTNLVPSLAMRPRFRPPYGGIDDEVLAAVGNAGYTQTILWDIDTIDWRPTTEGGPTANEIAEKVLSLAQGGSIVLMHLGGYETLAALPGIVDGLLARGFQLVRVSEVIR